MGEETIQGLSEELWARFSAHLAESAIDQIITKADLEELATKEDLEALATKAEMNGLVKRLGELEETVKGSNSGSVARPLLWASLNKSGRWIQAGLLAIALSVSLGGLGLVLALLQLAGVPVGDLLGSLSK